MRLDGENNCQVGNYVTMNLPLNRLTRNASLNAMFKRCFVYKQLTLSSLNHHSIDTLSCLSVTLAWIWCLGSFVDARRASRQVQ